MIRPFGSTAALVAMSILVSCRGSSAPPETPDAWGSVMVGNSSSADSGSRGGGGRGRGDGGGGRASRASQEDNLIDGLRNQRASPPLGRNPKLYFARTAAKLKRAALQWHADAVANHGWPSSVTPKAIMNSYSQGSKFEQCRFKARALKRFASGEPFNILISGGSVTAGSDLCKCQQLDSTKCSTKSASGFEYSTRPWTWLLGGLLEGHHDQIENGRKEAREEGLKSEAGWLQEGMPFTVDTDAAGGYGITNVASRLNEGKLSGRLQEGVFRSKMKGGIGGELKSTWMGRYDLIIMDHSVNDNEDFGGAVVNQKGGDRINSTFNLVISQLRALESAPALLFTLFGGLISEGYGEEAKDVYQWTKHMKCFDLRLPVNQNRFGLPDDNRADDCYSQPDWQGHRDQHYIKDDKHNVWCFSPTKSWHVEDVTRLPIAERGVPHISMRNLVWPNLTDVPRNILQLWNGHLHPDGYAHNNMYGLTLFSMARMFEEASAASSNGDGSNGAAKDDEECDTLRTGQDSISHHQKLCPEGVQKRIFSATPNQPSANFQPLINKIWKYSADRPDKWGWILDEDVSGANKRGGANERPTLDQLGFQISFDLTGGVKNGPPIKTIVIEFMKSYSPEWGAVNVWFNDTPSPGSTSSGYLDNIQLDSKWEQRSSLPRSVVVHAAAVEGSNENNETTQTPSPFADWTYFLKKETELKTIYIEPVYTNVLLNNRFKFKLSGIHAC